jgi:hypothetical protein
MRLLWVLALSGLVLGACAPAQAVPTPLPTAVPPDSIPERGGWTVGFEYEFPAGRLAEGTHRYALLIHCPVVSADDEHYGWHIFDISPEMPLQVGPVYLRLFGLSRDSYSAARLPRAIVHPEQPLVATVHLVGLTREAAELAASSCELFVFWDNTGRQLLTAGEPFQQ